MLDQESRSDTIPVIDIATQDVDLGHEAKIGRIDDEVIFYLMSRGNSLAIGSAKPLTTIDLASASLIPLDIK